MANLSAVFLADILASPDYAAPRLIYADYLEDEGETVRPAFWRWSARLPVTSPDVSLSGKTFWWYRMDDEADEAFALRWEIEAGLFDCLFGRATYYGVARRKGYRSLLKALRELEAAWETREYRRAVSSLARLG